MTNLNHLTALCHQANRQWWHDPATGQPLSRNRGELLMLIVSELAEAMEAERKSLRDDKLPEFLGVEVELADALIRIFDYAGAFQLRLNEAFWAKMEYNLSREDHKPEARLAPGGKRW